PIADKVLISTAFFLLLVDAPAVWNYNGWIILGAALVVAREFMVSSLRIVAASKAVILAADKLGKAKTATQCVAVPLLLAGNAFVTWTGVEAKWIFLPGMILFGVSVLLAVLSGINYMLKNRKVFAAGGVAVAAKPVKTGGAAPVKPAAQPTAKHAYRCPAPNSVDGTFWNIARLAAEKQEITPTTVDAAYGIRYSVADEYITKLEATGLVSKKVNFRREVFATPRDVEALWQEYRRASGLPEEKRKPQPEPARVRQEQPPQEARRPQERPERPAQERPQQEQPQQPREQRVREERPQQERQDRRPQQERPPRPQQERQEREPLDPVLAAAIAVLPPLPRREHLFAEDKDTYRRNQYIAVLRLFVERQRVSIKAAESYFHIPFNALKFILDQMEKAGEITPREGAEGIRTLLITPAQFLEKYAADYPTPEKAIQRPPKEATPAPVADATEEAAQAEPAEVVEAAPDATEAQADAEEAAAPDDGQAAAAPVEEIQTEPEAAAAPEEPAATPEEEPAVAPEEPEEPDAEQAAPAADPETDPA
ncbi:MAG: hypothetical protein LBM78_04245, partial [Clostridiales bacterium]|nr:hypothetical protein [Clostridiales bacterium]